jgi:Tfp pilus assembly protein PilO
MTRRYVLAGVAGLALIIVFFLFVLKPKLADITDVRGQIETEQDRTQSLQIALRQLQQAQQQQPQTLARLAIFNRLLPATPDLPALIRQLQTAASASGMDLVSIAPSQPQNLTGATGIQVVSVNLQLNGGFFRLETFLTRLEDLQRVVEITSIGISPETDETTGQMTLSTTLTFRMYIVQPNGRLTGSTVATTPTPAATP